MKKSQSLSKKLVGISHRHQTYTKKTWKNQVNNVTKHYIIIKGIIPSLNMNLPIKQTKHNNTNKKQKKILSSNEIFERQMIFTQKLKKMMKDNNNITRNKRSYSSHKKFNLSEKIKKTEYLNPPGDPIDINNNKLQTYSTKCDYAILGTKLFNDLKLDTEQMEQYLMSKYLAGTDNIISEIEEPAYISNNIEFLNTITNLDINNNSDTKNQKKRKTIDASGKNSRNQNNKPKYNTKNFVNIQTNASKRFFTKFHTNLEEIKLKFQKNIKYNYGEEEKQSTKKTKNRRSKKKLPIIGERHKKSYKNYNNYYDKNIRSASMTKRMLKNLEQPRTNNLSWSKSKKLKNSSLNSNENNSELYANDNELNNESLPIINEINDINNNNLFVNNNSGIDSNFNYYQTEDKISNSTKSLNSKLSKKNCTPKNNKEQNSVNGPKKFISVKRFKKLNIPKLFINNNTNTNNNNNNVQTLKTSYSAKKMLCISDYVFIQELGKGSYAVVKLAIYKPTKEKFAIKIYNKQKLSNSQKNNYIKNEIAVLRDLNNPNIMKLYKVIHTQHYLYLVMEYIDGISLLDVIQNDPKRRITESRCKKLFYQIVKAIAYCQSKNICHRDIKLENILVQKNDIIKIIDFGFAIKCDKNQSQRLLCGTLCYMPPEIVNREEYNPFYSDIWSLGVLLYAMLFGIFPFRGNNDEIIMDLINENNLIFPENEGIIVSEDVKNLLKRIFVTDPCKRLKPDEILEHRWFSN